MRNVRYLAPLAVALCSIVNVRAEVRIECDTAQVLEVTEKGMKIQTVQTTWRTIDVPPWTVGLLDDTVYVEVREGGAAADVAVGAFVAVSTASNDKPGTPARGVAIYKPTKDVNWTQVLWACLVPLSDLATTDQKMRSPLDVFGPKQSAGKVKSVEGTKVVLATTDKGDFTFTIAKETRFLAVTDKTKGDILAKDRWLGVVLDIIVDASRPDWSEHNAKVVAFIPEPKFTFIPCPSERSPDFAKLAAKSIGGKLVPAPAGASLNALGAIQFWPFSLVCDIPAFADRLRRGVASAKEGGVSGRLSAKGLR